MRNQLLAVFVCVAALVAPAVSNAQASGGEREQIDRTFELSPGASVEVSSISGPVEVEVTNSGVAEVHIVRTGRSQADLACAPMTVEGSASRLVIRTEQSRKCRNSHRQESVRLRLPASVNFKASSVSGDVRVGRLEGEVRLSSISGDVRVEGASGLLDASSISGRVNVDHATGVVQLSSISGSVLVAIAELGETGISASSISGDLEFRFTGPVNADVRVDSISGRVRNDTPDMTVSKVGESSFRGRLGAGGAPITLSSISGDVRFTRQ